MRQADPAPRLCGGHAAAARAGAAGPGRHPRTHPRGPRRAHRRAHPVRGAGPRRAEGTPQRPRRLRPGRPRRAATTRSGRAARTGHDRCGPAAVSALVPVSRLVGRMAGMRPYLASAPSGPRDTAAARPRVVVAGGGIAGASAAVILAERGIPVVLCEAADRLGGRLGAHPRTLPDGTVQWVDHGFHGFFRQYYNWRRILGRISTGSTETGPLLHPLGSYPVISARWPDEEFDRLPPTPPLSILALTLRSPSLRLRELVRADHAVGLALLGFDAGPTYAHLDQLSAEQFLAALRLPERARVMLFNVFAHSFFND